MFGTGDYTYRTSWVSSVSPSLSTPSTCFTPRYFSSSTATYRTPFSRSDCGLQCDNFFTMDFC